MIVGLYGCASRVGSVADQNIPDERLSLIATAGASQAKTGHAIINSIDGQPVIGWKYKVAPGVHSVEISSQQMSLKRTIYVRTEAGKRYDIAFDGIAYVRDRKTADDQQYLGPDPSKPFTMLYAGSNGVFVEKDEYDRSVAKQKEEAYQIRELKRLDAESKQKARQIAIETFRTKPVPIGQKICREDDATIETATGLLVLGQPVKQQQKGIAQLSGFVEQVSADKIKITVSGIKFVTPTVDLNFPEMKKNLENYTYNGTALKVNSVFWDHKYGWFSCEN